MLALPSLRILRPRMKRGCVTTSTLTGLWITSHVVWSQAYKFKNNDYSQNAKELKARAEAKIEDFEQVKEAGINAIGTV